MKSFRLHDVYHTVARAKHFFCNHYLRISEYRLFLMRISFNAFFKVQFIDLEKFWLYKLCEMMDYVSLNVLFKFTKCFSDKKEKNAHINILVLMERISTKLRYYSVTGATQFRTLSIVNGGVRLLHCIINNLLNRGLLRIAIQRGGQKFRSDPEAFHVKVPAVRYELMPRR